MTSLQIYRHGYIMLWKKIPHNPSLEVHCGNRRYKAIYFVARVFEIFSYLILIAGVIASVIIAIQSELWMGALVLLGALLLTLILLQHPKRHSSLSIRKQHPANRNRTT